MIMGTVIVDSKPEGNSRTVVADFTCGRLKELDGTVIAESTSLFLRIESIILEELEKHI